MKKKTFYTKRLSRSVSQDAGQVRDGKYHIITGSDKRWKVIAEGNVRPTRVFLTQQSAITFARSVAKRHNGEIVVYTSNGEISKVITAA